MTRVLNVISDTNIGGAGKVLLNYLKYADTSAFETHVCLPRGSLLSRPLAGAGGIVHELDVTPDKSFDLRDIGKLKALIKEVSPDIVHTHGSLSGRIAARECGRLVIYTRHCVFPVSPFVRAWPGRLVNKLVNERYADRIIAVSPAAKKNLTDGGIREDLIDVVMNGVEPLERKSKETRDEFRASAGAREGDFLLGMLARIEEYKGHMLVLEAVRELLDEGRPVRLVIAGAGTFEGAVRRRAEELGLSEAVKFLGFISDVSAVLSAIDAQVNASFGTEASSLSLIEGMSIGLPAIVSDYGGNPYVVEDGFSGLLFRSRDSKSLASCVRRLMDEPGLLERLGQGAMSAYAARFTGRIFAKSIEEIYTKALKGVAYGKKQRKAAP